MKLNMVGPKYSIKMRVGLLYLVAVREQLKELTKQYDKSENDLKALQSVGQVCDLELTLFPY